MFARMFIILIPANRFALFCCRNLANGNAQSASNANINANHVTYSGCFGYSIQSAMDDEKSIIIPERKNELPNSDNAPVV